MSICVCHACAHVNVRAFAFGQDLAGEGDRLALEVQRRMVEVNSLFLQPIVGSGEFPTPANLVFLTCPLSLFSSRHAGLRADTAPR